MLEDHNWMTIPPNVRLENGQSYILHLMWVWGRGVYNPHDFGSRVWISDGKIERSYAGWHDLLWGHGWQVFKVTVPEDGSGTLTITVPKDAALNGNDGKTISYQYGQ